jgi:cytochrome c-type biogenesis protein
MTLLLVAFFAGVLTVLAPCVLPLLPMILWASIDDAKNKYAPYVVIASLSFSILLFSILLKATTLLIDLPIDFWKIFSGVLIIVMGVITLFPNIWKSISTALWFSDNSNKMLWSSANKSGNLKNILIGFSLGPVFSSCSPTYAVILAIVLPSSLLFGFTALIAYIAGLATVLLAIAVFGQRFIKNVKWIADPNGWFKKVLGIVFILVGLAIMTGYDKQIESAILDAGFINTASFEQSIVDRIELPE